MPSSNQKIAVLGAGSWGTALAGLLANNGHETCLWSHSQEHIAQLSATGENSRYLPNTQLPESLLFSADLEQLCSNYQQFLLVVPSRAFRETLEKMRSAGISDKALIMWGTKGFDAQEQVLLSELIHNILGQSHPLAIVSGPSFAKEVINQLPTALTVGSNQLQIAEQVAQLFHNDYTRVYSNDDIIGVQVGGAVKNIMAIACGISDGLGYGSNSKAALITRGLAEITRLGLFLGAQAETFQGLSGVGDLVLTCTDDKSRNRRFGLGIGQGRSIAEMQQEIGQEVEGLVTCKEVFLLAQRYNIEMPICEQVYNVLYKGISPKNAVHSLLKRSRAKE